MNAEQRPDPHGVMKRPVVKGVFALLAGLWAFMEFRQGSFVWGSAALLMLLLLALEHRAGTAKETDRRS